MLLLSRNSEYQRKAQRDTRSANKIIFKVPNKISHGYEHSSYYIGTKLWNELPIHIQKADDVIIFKKHVKSLYKTFKPKGKQS